MLLCTAIAVQAQHWVFLQDKCDEGMDYFDAPVCEDHIVCLQNKGVQILGKSRWLNAVLIADKDKEKVLSLDFVSGIRQTQDLTLRQASFDSLPYGFGTRHVDLIRLDSLHRMGYTGSGVLIGVFDGGFTNVDSIPAFDSLWARSGIVAHRDFELDRALSFDQSAHGMQVLSLMAAFAPDSLIGASPDADFVLARTEVTGSEEHAEEFNWVAAMEWADSIGVDIIHSSLGYSLFDSLQGDYTYRDMDGKTTIITLAAELAASRGIFITNSAGNSGNDPWFYITAPCDGEHVLCVGAVDSFGIKPLFSSHGPSSDGRVKPDVMAMGVNNTVYRTNGLLRTGSGTSFSAPIIASAVACLMQAHPDRSNEAIFKAIIESADRYDQPDSAYGYGIPDMLLADSLLRSFSNTTDVDAFELKVFPNPATAQLQVICSPSSAFTIFDNSGRTQMKGTLNNWYNFLDISGLPSGTFFILIEDGHAVQRQKFTVIQ